MVLRLGCIDAMRFGSGSVLILPYFSVAVYRPNDIDDWPKVDITQCNSEMSNWSNLLLEYDTLVKWEMMHIPM